MLTDVQLKQSELDELYDWVDSLELSRPKKNISRDFSDALMMAETISHYYPKLVELHNYPAGNSFKVKLSNWKTLNNKVLVKIGLNLTAEDCSRLASSTPMSIEAVLYGFKQIINDHILIHNQNGDTAYDRKSHRSGSGYPSQIDELSELDLTDEKSTRKAKSKKSTRVQELKEILSLIKEKVNIVENSLERKDGQIRELEEILREAER